MQREFSSSKMAGRSASRDVKTFLSSFQHLSTRSTKARAWRKTEWHNLASKNSIASLEDVELWVLKTLRHQAGGGSISNEGNMTQGQALALHKIFKPIYSRAFIDSKLTSKTGTTPLEAPMIISAGFISKAEFRLLIVNLCFWALSYDAFNILNNNMVDSEHGTYFTCDQWRNGSKKIRQHGFVALDQLDDISQDVMFENMDATNRGEIKFDDWSYYLKRFEVNQSDTGWGSLMGSANVRERNSKKFKNPSQTHRYSVSDEARSVCSIRSTMSGLSMSTNGSSYSRQSYRHRSTLSVGNRRRSAPLTMNAPIEPPSISDLTRGLAMLDGKLSEIKGAPASASPTSISKLNTLIPKSIVANRTLIKIEPTKTIPSSPKNRDIRREKDIDREEKNKIDLISAKNSRERALRELKNSLGIVHEKEVAVLRHTISRLRQENEEKVIVIENIQSGKNVFVARCDELSLEIEHLKDQLHNITQERDKIIEGNADINDLETQESTTKIFHSGKVVTKTQPQKKNQVQVKQGRSLVKLKSAMMLGSFLKHKRRSKSASLDSQDKKRMSDNFKEDDINYDPSSHSLQKEDNQRHKLSDFAKISELNAAASVSPLSKTILSLTENEEENVMQQENHQLNSSQSDLTSGLDNVTADKENSVGVTTKHQKIELCDPHPSIEVALKREKKPTKQEKEGSTFPDLFDKWKKLNSDETSKDTPPLIGVTVSSDTATSGKGKPAGITTNHQQIERTDHQSSIETTLECEDKQTKQEKKDSNFPDLFDK